MSETAERLRVELLQLSCKERAGIARALLRSLDDDGGDDEDEAAWEAELMRREAEILNGTAIGYPAEQVLDELRKKYS